MDEVERLRFDLAATRNGYNAQRAEVERLGGIINVQRNLIRDLQDVLSPYLEPLVADDVACVFCCRPTTQTHAADCPTHRADELLAPPD